MSPVLWVLLGACGFAALCLIVGAVRDSAGTWLVERLRLRRDRGRGV